MVKTSTPEKKLTALQKNLKPKKETIRFLLNYSKALEVKNLNHSPEMVIFKN